MTPPKSPTKIILEVDPRRHARLYNVHGEIETGIYVRAVVRSSSGDKFVSCDIADLTKASLIDWLREKSNHNEHWNEQIILAILGHEYEHVS